jgi:hypothetical protein
MMEPVFSISDQISMFPAVSERIAPWFLSV